MEETLRLEDLVQILKKKAAWIVLTMVAGIGLAAGVTFFLITPKYDSTAQLIVQNQEAEGSSGNLHAISPKDLYKIKNQTLMGQGKI